MDTVPEPTKTAMRAYDLFKHASKNTEQISRLLRIPESDILDMINHVRAWIAQEDNRAA